MADGANQRAERSRQRAESARAEAGQARQRAEQSEDEAGEARERAERLQGEARDKRTAAAEKRQQAADYRRRAREQGPPMKTTRFVYGPDDRLIGRYDKNGHAEREYIRLGSRPVATIDRRGKIHYIHTDHLGTPRVVSEPGGDVVWRWISSPFGDAQPNEDPDANGEPFTLKLRFPGQYFDAETGRHYNYFRTYDPGIGRYVRPDPLGLEGDGPNLYGYVVNDPINFVDPNGLAPNPTNRPGNPGARSGGSTIVRPGSTGPAVRGPYPGAPPSKVDRVANAVAKQAAKKLANKAVPGSGALIGSNPISVGIGALLYPTEMGAHPCEMPGGAPCYPEEQAGVCGQGFPGP